MSPPKNNFNFTGIYSTSYLLPASKVYPLLVLSGRTKYPVLSVGTTYNKAVFVSTRASNDTDLKTKGDHTTTWKNLQLLAHFGQAYAIAVSYTN